MSTYLIAFIVSDYGFREFRANSSYPTTQRVFANKDFVEQQTLYPLVEGVTILKALENYVQVPFALPKMDQVAMPKTYSGGTKCLYVLNQ